MQKWKSIKEYLDSLLIGLVDKGTDFDPHNLRMKAPSLLPKIAEPDRMYDVREKDYKPNSFIVNTKEECDAVRKIKSDVCNKDNPGHNWMKDIKDGNSKNMCNSLIEYAYDKNNHKKYSDYHLILGLTKIRDGYMKCSNERTMFDKGVMRGGYADKCATFEKGYNSSEYLSHDIRIEQERNYVDECQDIITDVKNKQAEEDRLIKKANPKTPTKYSRKSPKKSPKKSSPKKSPNKLKQKQIALIRSFPFDDMEMLLTLLQRYKEEGKPINQILKGGLSPSLPPSYLVYDELRPIKKLLEDAKETPKDKSKLDALIKQVQNVLEKYRLKLGSILISFENLGVHRRSYKKRRCNVHK